MKIEFGLLSILSVAFLLFFAFQGGQVELHSLDIGFSVDSEQASITIDPAFIVWTDFDRLGWHSLSGATFGNVMLIRNYYRNHDGSIFAYEFNHVRQFRALGWFIYPAQYFIPIEAPDICTPTLEWLPPKGWKDEWHFIALTIKMYVSRSTINRNCKVFTFGSPG